MKHTALATSLLLGTCLMFSGCTEAPPKSKPPAPKSTAKSSGAKTNDHEHAHAETGPHDGHLIELGKEEYHGELVHDEDAGTVTVYLLDSNAKNPVAAEAQELIINLKHDGKGEQFKLAASPQKGDAQGKASRFVSKDKELSEDLDHAGVEARLVVQIGSKSYTGEIKHDHDGHDHDEHKHKK